MVDLGFLPQNFWPVAGTYTTDICHFMNVDGVFVPLGGGGTPQHYTV